MSDAGWVVAGAGDTPDDPVVGVPDDGIARILRIALRVCLALVVLGFLPGLVEPFTPVKAAALRLFGLPMLAAIAFETLLRRGRPVWRAGALDAIVLAWGVAAAVSAAFGISPRLSWLGEIQQREGLLTTWSLVGLYLGARRSHGSTIAIRGTLLALVATASVAAVYAMLQRAGLDPVRWEYQSTYPVAGGRVVRVFATLGNPIPFGIVLAAALGVGVADATAPGAKWSWRLPLLVLVAAAIAATLSRGAWIGAVVAVVAAAAFALIEWGRGIGRRLAIVGAVAVVPAVLWSAAALRAPIAARVAESMSAKSESAPARLEIARSAIAIALERPWLGIGPDTFGLAFPLFQTPEYWRNSWIGNPANAHSAVLQMFATGGLLAMLVAAAWGIAIAIRLRPRRRAAAPTDAAASRVALVAAAASLAVSAVFNPIGLAGAAVLVMASALAASLGSAAPGEPASARTPRFLPGALAIAALAVAIPVGLAIASELRALAAAGRARGALVESTRLQASQQLAATSEAVRAARHATELAPREDELWRLRCDAALAEGGIIRSPRGAMAAAQLAGATDSASVARAATRLALLADSLGRDAERSARRALALEPLRASNLQRLANALALRGGWAQADSAFSLASARAPFDALILVDRVRVEMASGRPQAALLTAQRIVSLYPEDATGYGLEAGAWIVMGRNAEARAALERSLAARWEDDTEARRRATEQALRALTAADSLR